MSEMTEHQRNMELLKAELIEQFEQMEIPRRRPALSVKTTKECDSMYNCDLQMHSFNNLPNREDECFESVHDSTRIWNHHLKRRGDTDDPLSDPGDPFLFVEEPLSETEGPFLGNRLRLFESVRKRSKTSEPKPVSNISPKPKKNQTKRQSLKAQSGVTKKKAKKQRRFFPKRAYRTRSTTT